MNRTFLALAVLAAFVRPAAAAPESGFALGVQSAGSMYVQGTPSLRWVMSEKNALEFNPVVSYNRQFGNNYSYSYNTFGGYLGFLHNLTEYDGVRLNLFAEVGYQNYYYHYGDGSYKAPADTLTFGIGPDFEYFPSFIPGVSIGARMELRAQYVRNRDYSLGSPPTSSYSDNLSLPGEELVVRYYFGAGNDTPRRHALQFGEDGSR